MRDPVATRGTQGPQSKAKERVLVMPVGYVMSTRSLGNLSETVERLCGNPSLTQAYYLLMSNLTSGHSPSRVLIHLNVCEEGISMTKQPLLDWRTYSCLKIRLHWQIKHELKQKPVNSPAKKKKKKHLCLQSATSKSISNTPPESQTSHKNPASAGMICSSSRCPGLGGSKGFIFNQDAMVFPSIGPSNHRVLQLL